MLDFLLTVIMNLQWQLHQSQIISSLPTLGNESSSTDVTFVLDDDLTKISAHKIVLCASSIFLKTVFSTSETATSINLQGVESQDLKALLELLYTGQSTIKEGRYLELLSLATETEA